MAKFVNKKYNETINSISEGINNRIKNPWYIHNDKNPTEVDYYSQSRIESSLDENINQEYEDVGDQSPIKYHFIEDLILYGIPKIETNYGISENGFEADPIQGEAYVVPDTIIPVKGDFFKIKYLKQPLLFKVTGVTKDTLDNDFNCYRIQWIYERPDDKEINKQITEKFVAVVENSGTEFKSVIKKDEFRFIEKLDDTIMTLIEYFKVLFYSERVSTFIYNFNGDNFYDPFAIEFIMNNNLINTKDDYLYITQQCSLPASFALDYRTSLFYAIEKNDNKLDKYVTYSQAEYIQDVFSVFSCRSEPYFKIIYSKYKNPNLEMIDFMDEDLLDRIEKNKLYDDVEEKLYRNIIIKYFNKTEINISDIENVQYIKYNPDKTLFYEILFILYILEKDVKNLLH